MSSLLDTPDIRESALRLDVDRYHRLIQFGILPESAELLDGYVIRKLGKTPLHTWTVQFLADWLRKAQIPDHHVRVEQPLTIAGADSEPEPDLAVVHGCRDDYRMVHPTTAILVIEVAISTAGIDRQKARLYAKAGIPECWLVLPDERKVVIYRNPNSEAYAGSREVHSGMLSLEISKNVVLPLVDLFPE
ncbi:MAG: Uma2 family endonuclease [Planctomycetaceae bacterium]